jgi:wobble nucleotide-excising tRNase
MSKTLTEIAQALNNNKKVQLIYAFNGTGKTRLSKEFRRLVDFTEANNEIEPNEEAKSKVLYYNAFTEDLFYWDNDLINGTELKLKIQPNSFTNWVLGEAGQDQNIITNFQKYTDDKLTPRFSENNTEIQFSFERGNEERSEYVKISKGEESCFIWSVFYTFLKQVISVLNVPEIEERETDKFNHLEYIFIDDPVSSLDDNHLIELAVDIAKLVVASKSKLKFIITTHNQLFFNVLSNELNKNAQKYKLEKFEDGTYALHNQLDDSPFSYHLYLLAELEKAIQANTIQKYHFNFLRNILEKTATFLGYKEWKKLLPDDSAGAREAYYNRIINFSSHSKHGADEVAAIPDSEKSVLAFLVRKIKEIYHFA